MISGTAETKTGTFIASTEYNTIIPDDDNLEVKIDSAKLLNRAYDGYALRIYNYSEFAGYLPVTVSGDANLTAANIKKDVSIFGVTGTYAGNTVLVSTTTDTNGGTIETITTTEDPIYLEPLNVTSNGSYVPTTNHYYNSVNVNVSGGSGSISLQEKTGIVPTESS